MSHTPTRSTDIKQSTTSLSNYDSNEAYDSGHSLTSTSISGMKPFDYITDPESSIDGRNWITIYLYLVQNLNVI